MKTVWVWWSSWISELQTALLSRAFPWKVTVLCPAKTPSWLLHISAVSGATECGGGPASRFQPPSPASTCEQHWWIMSWQAIPGKWPTAAPAYFIPIWSQNSCQPSSFLWTVSADSGDLPEDLFLAKIAFHFHMYTLNSMGAGVIPNEETLILNNMKEITSAWKQFKIWVKTSNEYS